MRKKLKSIPTICCFVYQMPCSSYKIVVFGKSGVGKTTFIRKLTAGYSCGGAVVVVENGAAEIHSKKKKELSVEQSFYKPEIGLHRSSCRLPDFLQSRPARPLSAPGYCRRRW